MRMIARLQLSCTFCFHVISIVIVVVIIIFKRHLLSSALQIVNFDVVIVDCRDLAHNPASVADSAYIDWDDVDSTVINLLWQKWLSVAQQTLYSECMEAVERVTVNTIVGQSSSWFGAAVMSSH